MTPCFYCLKLKLTCVSIDWNRSTIQEKVLKYLDPGQKAIDLHWNKEQIYLVVYDLKGQNLDFSKMHQKPNKMPQNAWKWCKTANLVKNLHQFAIFLHLQQFLGQDGEYCIKFGKRQPIFVRNGYKSGLTMMYCSKCVTEWTVVYNYGLLKGKYKQKVCENAAKCPCRPILGPFLVRGWAKLFANISGLTENVAKKLHQTSSNTYCFVINQIRTKVFWKSSLIGQITPNTSAPEVFHAKRAL